MIENATKKSLNTNRRLGEIIFNICSSQLAGDCSYNTLDTDW